MIAHTRRMSSQRRGAAEALHVLVCTLDDRPGYSVVPNPLYDGSCSPVFGDANETVTGLLESLPAMAAEQQVKAS
jgi:hypothetical protein